MNRKAIACLFLVIVLPVLCGAQTQDSKSSACTFDDGKQISVRYEPAAVTNHRLPDDKIWSPGNSPMFLFTSAPLEVGDTQIPVGAYSMYVIPQKDRWTLVFNKNVSEESKYDEHQDVVRAVMQVGQLSDAQPFGVFFGHSAPKQCNMRIYEGKTGTWIEFKEQ
ncbi:MAG TPA: DUF2911 domain-containing protein [Terriglobales bacterium]|nr:DUF2911 domain-containing protein [Terriglobales bacterium]